MICGPTLFGMYFTKYQTRRIIKPIGELKVRNSEGDFIFRFFMWMLSGVLWLAWSIAHGTGRLVVGALGVDSNSDGGWWLSALLGIVLYFALGALVFGGF
jgi:hypothetical protein